MTVPLRLKPANSGIFTNSMLLEFLQTARYTIDREDLVYKTKREKNNAVIDEIVNMNKQGRLYLSEQPQLRYRNCSVVLKMKVLNIMC